MACVNKIEGVGLGWREDLWQVGGRHEYGTA